MKGISISDLKPKQSSSEVKKRRSVPNLSSLSSDYSNPKNKMGQNQTKSGLKADQEKTGSKVVAQSSSKLVANQEQSSSKLVAKSSSKKTEKKETGSKLVAQLVAKGVANQEQSSSKLVARSSISELSGVQFKLLKLLYFSCRKKGQKCTESLSMQFLSETLKTTPGTIKNAIHRLIQKGFITKYRFKNGRGGWTQYTLNEHTYSDMLQNETSSKLVANWEQTDSKVVAQPVAELVASPPSSNSSNINTITTSESKPNAEWEELQTPEVLKSLGFGKSHLTQIQNKFSFTPKEVLGFLEAFAFDLENGERERLKGRGINPIGYFFGALKNGGYNPVNEGFKTSEELAKEEMIARLEKKQREREEKNKKLEELLFEEWLESKSKEDLLKIEEPLHGYLDMFHKSALKEYFVLSEMEIFKNNHI